MSDWTTWTRPTSMPSSSATIWISTERLPWPISVDPLSTMAEPSVWIRTIAVETGKAPASDALTPKPIPVRGSPLASRRSDPTTISRSVFRSASSPRLPGSSSSWCPTRLRSRISNASMPSSSAARSRLVSPASAPSGAPNPRSDEAGEVLV